MQILLNGLVAGGQYALVALGFALIYSVTRFFHFSHGAAYLFAAYAFFLAISTWRSLPIAVVVALLVGGVCGASIDAVIYRRLRKRRATPNQMLLVSLGLYVVAQNLISLTFGDQTRTVSASAVPGQLEIGAAQIDLMQAMSLAIVVTLFTVVSLALKHTTIGKEIRAVASDPDLARVSGVRLQRVYSTVFFVGSVLAGSAAVLVSFETDIYPTMAFHALLMSVVAVVVGGHENLTGSVLGAVALGILQHIAARFVGSEWQNATVLSVFVGIMIFRARAGASIPKQSLTA